MENISEKINSILSDPNSMAQIQAMMSSMGLGGDSAPQPQPTPQQNLSPALQNPEILGKLSSLAPLLSATGQEDDSTRLLQALRPLLSHEKQDRLDKAMKMLRLLRMIPLIKDSGMLSSLI